MWKRLVFLIIVSVAALNVNAQVPEFDKLEMYYAQGLYKKVYRKANGYLDKPEYDFSLLPSYYRSLAMFQLSENKYWKARNPNSLKEARTIYLELRSTQEGQKVLEAHVHEIMALKSDLMSRLEDFKRMELQTEFEELQSILVELFNTVPTIESDEKIKPEVDNQITEFQFNSKDRNEIVQFAQKQIGVRYVYSGSTPSGFDCSGFTGYVMKAYNKELPRRAVEQYEKSVKLKQKSVQKGDLVFFDNGSGISHVGMIVSEKGAPLVMIHASTSKGVILTNIETSEYWSKRLAGFGTYIVD